MTNGKTKWEGVKDGEVVWGGGGGGSPNQLLCSDLFPAIARNSVEMEVYYLQKTLRVEIQAKVEIGSHISHDTNYFICFNQLIIDSRL